MLISINQYAPVAQLGLEQRRPMVISMRKLENTIIAQIGVYRRNGYSYKEISKLLDVAKGTSYNYGTDIRISKKGNQRLKSKLFTKKERSIKIPTKITVSLVRILGHCLFDGSVNKDTVNYSNTSLELVKQFITDIKDTFLIDFSSLRYYKKKSICYQVFYPYVSLVRYLKSFTPSYSTSSPICQIPKILFTAKKSLICEFLRTFWEDEGSIKADKSIVGKTKSKAIAIQLQKLHKKILIGTIIRFDKKNKAYEIYVPREIDNLKRFIRNIGFGQSTVTRGKYKGYKKMAVFFMLFKIR